MTIRLSRGVLWVLFTVSFVVQAWLAWQWITQWGFFGGIWHWIESAKLDAVYAAAVIDFILFIALVGLALQADYPAEKKRGPLYYGWCFFYLVWPSLGILAYLLFIKRQK